MRKFVALVTALALLGTGCSDRAEDPGVEALAEQADRIAELLDEGEDCRALEAARGLQTLADDETLAEEVRTGAATYADQARQQLACEDATTSPTPRETTPDDPDPNPDPDPDRDADPDPDPDPDDGERDDRGEGNEGNGGNEGNPGRGNGNGPPDRDDEDDRPGRGEGRGDEDDD